MKKDLKAKYRKGLNAQYQDNVNNKDKYSTSSGANQKCFNSEVQKDTKIISMKDGDSYVIRFVPYEVDETHPMVKKNKMDPGDVAYMLGFDMHVFGQDNVSLLCPHGTYSKKCPICERASEAQDDGDDETYKALRPRRRVLYNIVILKDYSKDKNAKRDPNEIFVLHESQYLFEKGMLDELKKGGDEDEEEGSSEYNIYQFCVGVTEPEESLALKVMCTGKQINKSFSFKVLTHKDWFDKVDEDAVLEKALPLHKLVKEFSYEELENMLSGTEVSSDEEDDDDDEEERRTLKKKSAAKKTSRRDEDDDDDEEEERPHKSSRKAKAEEEEDEDEDDEEEEEEEERSHKSSKKAKIDAVNDDDDEDDGVAPFDTDSDGGSDEEEYTCPNKHKFGVEVNRFDDCETCDLYDECLEKKRADRRK